MKLARRPSGLAPRRDELAFAREPDDAVVADVVVAVGDEDVAGR